MTDNKKLMITYVIVAALQALAAFGSTTVFFGWIFFPILLALISYFVFTWARASHMWHSLWMNTAALLLGIAVLSEYEKRVFEAGGPRGEASGMLYHFFPVIVVLYNLPLLIACAVCRFNRRSVGNAVCMIIQTERLLLREMTQADFPALCKIMQDEDVMYAYEGIYSDIEVQSWLDKRLLHYEKHGFGLWAVVLKETGEMIGQCGLSMQDFDGRQVTEVGYLFQKAFWHRGYATEAAIACREYAFEKLGVDEVFSIIRDTNTASQNVAIHNGMTICGEFVKNFRGVDISAVVYSVRRTV